jgi:hypothetical protein
VKLRHPVLRHGVAAFAAIIGFIAAGFLFNPLLNYVLTGSIPDPLVHAPAGTVYSCLAVFWIPLVFAPTAALGEAYVLGRWNAPPWIKHAIVVFAFPVEGILICSAAALGVGGANPVALAFLGLDLLIAGASYWVAYIGALRILPSPAATGG